MDELKQKPPPEGVDPSKLEMYLNDDEFQVKNSRLFVGLFRLISSTITLHVRFTFWYISLPSSAKQQRQMTNFTVLWRT